MLQRLRRQLFRRTQLPKTDSEDTLAEQLVMALMGRVTAPERSPAIVEKVEQFQALSPSEQEKALPATYLILEQFLTEIDPLSKVTRHQLRLLVQRDYEPLLAQAGFGLIFETPRLQEILLCRYYLEMVLSRSMSVMGVQLNEPLDWLSTVPNEVVEPLPFGLQTALPKRERDWFGLLKRLSDEIFELLESRLGKPTACRFFENSYEDLAGAYVGLETFPAVINILPEALLDEQKLSLLSYRQMQRALLENVELLQDTNDVLLRRNEALQLAQTQLMAAQETALESSARFRAVLDTVGEGIITFDDAGAIVLANNEVEVVWGVEARSLPGRDIHTLFTKPIFSLEPVNRMPLTAPPLSDILGLRLEVMGLTAEKQEFPVEICVTETTVSNRKLFTIAATDITERKAGEQALEQARYLALETSDLKSRLLIDTTQNLRTPLSTMVGYAGMMREELAGEVNDKQVEMLDKIIETGEKISTLLNDLLKRAETTSSQLTLNNSPFDLPELLIRMQMTFSDAAEQRNLYLTNEMMADMPLRMLGDHRKVQQVLDNLVSNAIKFTDEGGVHVKLYLLDEQTWAMDVVDTGRGIEQTKQVAIFDPRHRSIADLANPAGGIGLGLSIIKQLVTLMNGSIYLTSQIGQGSTFTVTLPIIPFTEKSQ